MENEKQTAAAREAEQILMSAHFQAFNAFYKLNRLPGQIRAFDRQLAALGTLERAKAYLEVQ